MCVRIFFSVLVKMLQIFIFLLRTVPIALISMEMDWSIFAPRDCSCMRASVARADLVGEEWPYLAVAQTCIAWNSP